ncbi:hypothetical protein F3157_13440 [Virgibacillus dakarensis]|uniref:Uncharacterized protein n=1 Tax=Lentibacillus populi TaxID=1827502 RepID=A0A9W5TU66_9BACI|nr:MULTISPECIES: hypothetical protein [Bacillaceae]MBT2216704.1 hypothetical protein [Virgibacillus dakarensis]MTW86655.1 hypothetical protein [Virgibacillus dakarensis]GGB30038.1 hypothetical protein GCM10011409_04240 [Lentibacillus populi]
MKKFLLYLLAVLLITIIVSFLLGYFTFGMIVGFIFMVVAIGAANVYQLNNREYIHHKIHGNNDRKKKW